MRRIAAIAVLLTVVLFQQVFADGSPSATVIPANLQRTPVEGPYAAPGEPALASQPDQLSLSCPIFASAQLAILNATFAHNGAGECTDVLLSVRFPNGTVRNTGPSSCANGLHSFILNLTNDGNYEITAQAGYSNAGCTVARAFASVPRRKLPELNWISLVLAMALSLGLMRMRGQGGFRRGF